MPTDERVLVIPTERFRAAGYFHGFRATDAAFRAAVLDPAAFAFRPRAEVETDPTFKQLIPYVVLKHGGRLFHYRRAGGTESRLRARWSVGIGGHISEDDAAGGTDPYTTGMLRELTEEVAIGCGWRDHFLGFINDDRTPVGSVHLGVVHLLELESPDVRAREEGLADGGFAPAAELAARAGEFETWSQFVLEELVRPGPGRV
jgi:predicted NUDIX family phosphoesterase